MESIDEFLKRYEQRRWLFILTSPVLLPVFFVLLFTLIALAGAFIFATEACYEYGEYILSYPKRYLAIWRGVDDGQA